jgi:hypothetical protein
MNPFPRQQFRAAFGLFAAALGMAAAPAGAQTLQADYKITLGGLSIGVASLRAKFAADKYDLALAAKLTGLVGAVTGGSGSATAAGGLGAAQPVPATYSVRSSNGKETRTVRMALTGGNVQNFAIEPPLEDKPEDGKRVPVEPVHKRGIVDPISALVMPMKNGAAGTIDPTACNRTIPVFDGASRFNVTLSYKATQTISTEGYSGPVLICAARYQPIAGHKPERKSTKFMIENRDMEAWLVPVNGSRVLAPYRIAVKTQVGLSVIQATSFAVSASAAAAR